MAFLGVRSSATMTFVNGIWVSFLLLALYAFALPFAFCFAFCKNVLSESNENFVVRKVLLVVVLGIIEFIDAICIESNAVSFKWVTARERGIQEFP